MNGIRVEKLQFGHGFTAVENFRMRRSCRGLILLQFGHGFTAVENWDFHE